MEIPKTPQVSYMIGRFNDYMSEGYNSSEIRSMLRDEGLKFSNSLAADIYKALQNPSPLDIRFTPGDQYPDPETFNVSSLEMKGQYGYLVSITAQDALTGTAIQGVHLIWMDELGTVDEIKDNAMYILDERYFQGSANVQFVDIIKAYTQ